MPYTAAEQALYWASDHARSGAAVEVCLSSGERLDLRMFAPYGRRNARELRAATLQVNVDDEGVTASPDPECHLKVTLRAMAFGAADAAPLSVVLQPGVALVIISACGRLVHVRPDPKGLTVECPLAAPGVRQDRQRAALNAFAHL